MTRNDENSPYLWYLDELNEDTASNRILLKQLLDLFNRDMPAYQHRLFGAMANEDRALFNQTAHTLRSSLYLLGLYNEAGTLQEVERETSDFSPDTAHRLADLMKRIDQAIGVLTQQVR